jgi:hypothetical protein
MAGKKKSAKKPVKTAAKPATPDPSSNPQKPTNKPPPTAASEILDAMQDVQARQEAARQAFTEQREAIRKTLEEQRKSAMDFLSDFRRTLETDEANMVHIATEQAKAALEALLPPSVRASTQAAPAANTTASKVPPTPQEDAGDPVLDADQKLLTALKLVVLDAVDAKKLNPEDSKLVEQVLLESLKKLARKQSAAKSNVS